jgi:hypothetical protein
VHSGKTGTSTYEVEYTIEKVCRFRISKREDASSASLRLGLLNEAIPAYGVQIEKPVFERDWFSLCAGLYLCSLTTGDAHAGTAEMLKNFVGSA